MTAAERMQRTREREREKGVRTFMIKVGSPYREMLEAWAGEEHGSVAAAFRDIALAALVRLDHTAELFAVLRKMGYTDEQAAGEIEQLTTAVDRRLRELKAASPTGEPA